MRITLLFFFCIFSLTASAQWYRLKKREPRPDLLQKTELTSQRNFLPPAVTPRPRLKTYTLSPSDFHLEIMEDMVMKTAQHNMRFRIYDVASYNFSDLADLYVQQSRFSEAKWYFLQSTQIARQQNNDRLTVSNLSKLALVKSEIGDFMLAQQDLREARDIAASHGWLSEVIEAEKKLVYIQHNRITSLRGEMRYAELSAQN